MRGEETNRGFLSFLKKTQNKQKSIGPEFCKKLSMLLKTKSRSETCAVRTFPLDVLWVSWVLHIVGYFAWRFEIGWRGVV